MNAEQLKEQLSHLALSKLLDPPNAHQVGLTQSHGAHCYKVLKSGLAYSSEDEEADD